ncbi:MAG: hypothetical protein QMC93_01215 [Patescibacteria group bacterium]|nr:hypothetical protein [Patescibacteria group bacterium]
MEDEERKVLKRTSFIFQDMIEDFFASRGEAEKSLEKVIKELKETFSAAQEVQREINDFVGEQEISLGETEK